MAGFSHTLAQTMKVIVTWQGPNGTKAVNVFWLLCTGGSPSSPTTLQNGAQQVVSAATIPSNSFLSNISSLWQIITAEGVDNSGGPNFVLNTYSTAHGTLSGDTYPPSVCQGLSWKVNARYRGGHPRTYLPGTPAVAAASVGSNVMASGQIASLETAQANFLSYFPANPVAGVTYAPGTIAASRHKVQLTPPVFYPWLSGTVHPRFDTQRRRLGKEVLP